MVTPGTGSQNSEVTPGSGNSQGTSAGPSGVPSQNTSSVPGESASAGPGEQTGTQEGAGISQGWKQDQTGWYYAAADGSRAANQWLKLQDTWYWFDGNGEIIRTDRIIILIRQREPWYQTGGFRMEEPGIT